MAEGSGNNEIGYQGTVYIATLLRSSDSLFQDYSA